MALERNLLAGIARAKPTLNLWLFSAMPQGTEVNPMKPGNVDTVFIAGNMRMARRPRGAPTSFG
jgi:hypothetical protein